jgi:hypothetical protein
MLIHFADRGVTLEATLGQAFGRCLFGVEHRGG